MPMKLADQGAEAADQYTVCLSLALWSPTSQRPTKQKCQILSASMTNQVFDSRLPLFDMFNILVANGTGPLFLMG